MSGLNLHGWQHFTNKRDMLNFIIVHKNLLVKVCVFFWSGRPLIFYQSCVIKTQLINFKVVCDHYYSNIENNCGKSNVVECS